ncbi:MAG: DNA replication and repair protein RecF [Candidatus Roizmanbacteria bacterium]
MILHSLELRHFRCHHTYVLAQFSPHLNLIVGPNAMGKTSILEAIYMLSQGRGFREDDEIELLTVDRDDGFVSASYKIGEDQVHEASVTYQRDDLYLNKKYFIDKAPTSIGKFRRTQVSAVLFAPHHLDIITHSPTYRREYLDTVISRVDPVYAKAIREYGLALRKRNALLEEEMDAQTRHQQLAFWNQYLIERADIIFNARRKYIEMLNDAGHFAHRWFKAIYHANRMTPDRLAEKQDTEIAARRTLIGPQKDDVEILISTQDSKTVDPTSFRNVHHFGSRSQQRLALLWLKIREIEYLEAISKSKPLLLLDDILSEFDESNRRLILELIPRYQTVMTSAEEDLLDHTILPESILIRV